MNDDKKNNVRNNSADDKIDMKTFGLQDWNAEAPPNTNLRTAGIIFASTVGVLCGLTAPFVFTRSKLPYMATPKAKVRRALQHLQRQHCKKVFVDLGSGDGEAVQQAARLGYRAIGLELNFSLWMLSSLRRQFLFTRQERSRSQILWANMFDYHLQRDFAADTVMIFGVTPLMRQISQKLEDECDSGTHVLSYRFGIPLCGSSGQPKGDDKDDAPLLKANIIYDQQEMRIYEKLSEQPLLAEEGDESNTEPTR